MSAAATAAGYLYASGRLRGRAQREQEDEQRTTPEPQARARPPRPRTERPRVAPIREEVRVAALPQEGPKPRRTPTIQYRTRRWKPDAA
jgi:hypothetical protein